MADGAQMLQVEAPPRYSGYSAQVFDEQAFARICERMADGETITGICEEPGAPSIMTVWRWAQSSPAASEAYDRAREAHGHALAGQALDAARNAKDAQLGRLLVDTLKWTASKSAPRHFGDSVQLKHADANGEKLDTAPLVASLLSSMQPQANTAPIDVTPRVVAKREEAPAPRDARAPDLDVSDLV